VAERTLDQWWRVTTRWGVGGAVAGLVVALWAAVADEGWSPLHAVAVVPMGAALALLLRYSVYRYEYARVWGWRAFLLLCLVCGGLMTVSVAGLCASDLCGERPPP
jgi:hypothetical protein